MEFLDMVLTTGLGLLCDSTGMDEFLQQVGF